ncbi:MAG: DUF6152 family protein [Gammaproteobacteria bacterium]
MRFIASILVSFCLPIATSAHHAFAANYDVTRIGTVEGIVEEVFWASPHVHFYIRVTTEDREELWDVEDANLNSMASRGWNRNTITAGDEIRVTGRMGRDGKRRIWASEIVRVDGRPLD